MISTRALKYISRISLLFASLGFSTACTTTGASPDSNQIQFNKGNLYPEGIAFNSITDEFLVSSLYLGEIGAVDRKGKYRTVAAGPDLLSVIGVKFNEKRQEILACNSHLGVTRKATNKLPNTVAELLVMDAGTGTRKATYDLGSLRPGDAHFCNDMAFDPNGNIYVTDSFTPVLYQISPDGKTSVLLNAPSLAVSQPGKEFGFNGILHHPDNFLLVNHQMQGKLFKVALPAAHLMEVSLDMPIHAADGMVMVDNKTIDVVLNGTTGHPKKTVRLKSDDNWKTARQTAAAEAGELLPTTATRAGSSTYVIDSRALELFDGKGARSDTFVIYRADLN